MNLIIVKNKASIAEEAGTLILEELKSTGKKFNLGLATGSSPITTYKYLIDDFKKNKTDWSKVTTFNLDEYVGLAKDHPQSYHYFMRKNLFDGLKISEDKTFIPKGTGDYLEFAKKYDDLISEHGGIDLQILGLGSNGHIGFNEPPADFNSKTQLVKLVASTISDNARFFKDKNEVPKEAVSMGIKTIMNAKKIIMVANGKEKAKAIKSLVEGKITIDVPCTILQKHSDFTLIIDEEAAMLLKK